jgi:TetR/AcrR family transcriptional regulator, repressor for divergent bdcA
MSTELTRGPGRPRKFDVEQGVATALTLFHEMGYDAVSVSDITGAVGINTPSFYAAYGSKYALFERVLDLHLKTTAIPVHEILTAGQTPADALVNLLKEAARRYGADRRARGCLMLEAARCGDAAVRALAHANGVARLRAAIRRFVATTHPRKAERVADYISTTMVGLSSSARAGMERRRLSAVAEVAGQGVVAALHVQSKGG